MKHFDFFKYDLNLLVAFDALYAERSVTRAAQKVGVGQPGMSHSLARLRGLFKDELFVRAGKGVEPTAAAARLAGPIRDVLQRAHSVLTQGPAFDPACAARDFTLAIPDGQQVVVLPRLVAGLWRAAPGVRLRTVAFDRRRVLPQLEESEIDLAIGVFPRPLPRCETEALYTDRHACVYNPSLVRAGRKLTLKQYLAQPHILLSHAGDAVGVVDAKLGMHNLKRDVLATTPYSHVVLLLVRQIAAIGIVPRRMAERLTGAANLAMCEPPVATGGFQVSMAWHVRNTGEPAHRWLREQVAAVCREA